MILKIGLNGLDELISNYTKIIEIIKKNNNTISNDYTNKNGNK